MSLFLSWEISSPVLVNCGPCLSGCLGDALLPPRVSSPLVENKVSGGSWQKCPRRLPLCGAYFQTLFFSIWVEQLGLLVPVEVRLAAPRDSWQAGKVHLCRVSSGDQVAKLVPIPVERMPAWRGGKGWRMRGADFELYPSSLPPDSDLIILASVTLANAHLAPKWWRDGQRG